MKPVSRLVLYLEALQGAYAEIDAMMDTYEDYVPSGDLCEQIEEAIADLQLWLREKGDK